MQIIRDSGGSSGPRSRAASPRSTGQRCVVLVDSCALASDIDREAVEATRTERTTRSARSGDDDAGERARLEGVVARAELELEVAAR